MSQTKVRKLPLIKWTGSKRKQAPEIVKLFPEHIDTYYECFLGGGSVLHELLNQVKLGNKTVNKVVCSDLNSDLIGVFNIFRNPQTRKELFDFYVYHREKLIERSITGESGRNPTPKESQTASSYYYEMRERFNSMLDDPLLRYSKERYLLFFWIARNSFNGLIRYNPKGKFNASFHIASRWCIGPDALVETFNDWGELFDLVDIEFHCKSFEEVIKDAKEGDVIYMDPPYENTTGMYFNDDTFDKNMMFDQIRLSNDKGVLTFLSYDGKTGEEDRTASIPSDIYIEHRYIDSGTSSFKKLRSNTANTGKRDRLKDSLYICRKKNINI